MQQLLKFTVSYCFKMLDIGMSNHVRNEEVGYLFKFSFFNLYSDNVATSCS